MIRGTLIALTKELKKYTTTFNTFLAPMLKLSVPPSWFKAKNWPSWPMSVSTGPISPSISLDGLEHAIGAGSITS